MDKKNYNTIDDYMSYLPEDNLLALEHIREMVRTLVPQAEEVISYQIPTFKYHGTLVGFAAFKNHCSFFTCDGSTVEKFKDELKGFDYVKSGIHFTPDKPIPDDLLERIIMLRVVENEARALAKKKK
jgi:uncharacterized protein YdhG (YjbR/CyaY superfamily)